MAKKKTYRKSDYELKQGENDDLGADRQPPQAIELEIMVLGAILIDNEVLNDVLQILEPENFYMNKHKTILQAIINLDSKKEPVDPTTLKEELKRMDNLNDVGGIEYIMELTTSVSTSANVKYYTRIILKINSQKSNQCIF
ncbi:MAG: hypothetical protein IPL67_05015 [Ignavibacteria bacterium]|nr:hypothetical protein [Ignavibacteria bacterium]